MKNNVTTVIVLGNARSGTSMTAGMLYILGVHMTHISNPSSQNPKGAFENPLFNRLTDHIMTDLKKGKDKSQIKEQYDEKIKQLISDNEKTIWGWKSATTHWGLDIFLDYVKNPHLVIVTRNILHNAQSWVVHMRDHYKKHVTLVHALRTMAQSTQVLIEQACRANTPKLWITYEDIKQHPVQEAKRMAEFLGLEFDETKEQEIKQFIMPEYSTLKQKN